MADDFKIRKSSREFLSVFLEGHQDDFEAVMAEMKDTNPKKWLSVYVDMMKLVVPKQQDVNVSVGMNRDFEELRQLANTRVTPKLTARPLNDIEADFEELPELIPSKLC